MNDLNFADTWFATTLFLGVPLTNWALALAVGMGCYLAFTFGLRLAMRRATRIAKNTDNRVDDTLLEVLSGTNRWLLALAAMLIGLSMIELSDRWSSRVGQLWFVALALQFALWANTAIGIFLRRYTARQSSVGMTQAITSSSVLSLATPITAASLTPAKARISCSTS